MKKTIFYVGLIMALFVGTTAVKAQAVTYDFTGTIDSYLVPAGVTAVTIEI